MRTGFARTKAPPLSSLVILATLAALPFALGIAIDRTTYDVWGGLVWAPFLVFVSLPICRRAAAAAGEPDAARFLMLACVLKVVVGTVLRYGSAYAIYGGQADATRYDREGGLLVDQIRQLDFGGLGKITGTRFMEVLTGSVQAVIGDTRVGTYFVFSWMAFVGMCLFYVAVARSIPRADLVILRRFLFLAPTLVFWPSSIGKEAVMMLCLGLATYGLSRVLTGFVSGLPWAALGVWVALVVRAHFVLALCVGVGFALLPFGRTEGSRHGRSLVLAIAACVVMVPLAVAGVEDLLDLEALNSTTAAEALEDVDAQSSQGGSEFEAPGLDGPASYLLAIPNVLLRPLPWEATNPPALLISVESLVLVTILLHRLRSGGRVRQALRSRVSRLALGYSLAFCFAFSAIANFGILSRQRSLLLPFLAIILASVPERRDAPEPDDAASRQPRRDPRATPAPVRAARARVSADVAGGGWRGAAR